MTTSTQHGAVRNRARVSEPTGNVVQSTWRRSGKVRMGILLWALGVPLPIILIYLLIRGCA